MSVSDTVLDLGVDSNRWSSGGSSSLSSDSTGLNSVWSSGCTSIQGLGGADDITVDDDGVSCADIVTNDDHSLSSNDSSWNSDSTANVVSDIGVNDSRSGYSRADGSWTECTLTVGCKSSLESSRQTLSVDWSLRSDGQEVWDVDVGKQGSVSVQVTVSGSSGDTLDLSDQVVGLVDQQLSVVEVHTAVLTLLKQNNQLNLLVLSWNSPLSILLWVTQSLSPQRRQETGVDWSSRSQTKDTSVVNVLEGGSETVVGIPDGNVGNRVDLRNQLRSVADNVVCEGRSTLTVTEQNLQLDFLLWGQWTSDDLTVSWVRGWLSDSRVIVRNCYR